MENLLIQWIGPCSYIGAVDGSDLKSRFQNGEWLIGELKTPVVKVIVVIYCDRAENFESYAYEQNHDITK